MVMIRVNPETLIGTAEGSVTVPSRGLVDTFDDALAAYHVKMHHAHYYEPGVPEVPVNTAKPQLSALTAKFRDVITCTTGTWEGVQPLEFFYKWDVDGVDIPSAVTAQHTITVTDKGKSLMCRVRCVDINGEKLIADCEAPCVVS